jgi:uncharacterized DUF497 family protein
MKRIRWNSEKNELLRRERGVTFEEVVHHIENDDILDRRKHPNREKYPDQTVFVIDLGSYVYLVPCVENDEEIFLKTVIPSRKAKKEYRNE